jgi:acyl-CoA thioester hydrolase
MIHEHAIRVYFEDTDAGGVAYHAAYLRWAERARTEALREWGMPHQEMVERHGCFLVVKRLAVEYERPARLDDLVSLRSRVRRVSALACVTQEAWRDTARLAVLEVELACVDAATLAPRRLPQPWLGALRERAPKEKAA